MLAAPAGSGTASSNRRKSRGSPSRTRRRGPCRCSKCKRAAPAPRPAAGRSRAWGGTRERRREHTGERVCVCVFGGSEGRVLRQRGGEGAAETCACRWRAPSRPISAGLGSSRAHLVLVEGEHHWRGRVLHVRRLLVVGAEQRLAQHQRKHVGVRPLETLEGEREVGGRHVLLEVAHVRAAKEGGVVLVVVARRRDGGHAAKVLAREVEDLDEGGERVSRQSEASPSREAGGIVESVAAATAPTAGAWSCSTAPAAASTMRGAV